MPVPLYEVNAFADVPFTGNPAAVCLLSEPADPSWMQLVAREMNLAETAFLVDRDDRFDLRWFTPTVEVDLCGHATLASAYVLWETGRVPAAESIRFDTRSGILVASRRGALVEIDLPATPPYVVETPPGLVEALGGRVGRISRTDYDYLVEVRDEATVRELAPDMARLRVLPVRGVIVTSRATAAGCDFVSRFFAPGSGIDEDPVTGSAHCALGPYWMERLGRREMVARQLSARGGTIHVRVEDRRVVLGGHATTVWRGELLV